MAVTLRRYRFTVDQYHRMGEAGIFHPECRVELVDGDIYEMSPIGPWHSGVVNFLNHRFVTGLGDRAVVHVQNPTELDAYARTRVPEVWIVNRKADAIEVFRGLSAEGYREVTRARRGDELAPAAFPDLRLAASDILG